MDMKAEQSKAKQSSGSSFKPRYLGLSGKHLLEFGHNELHENKRHGKRCTEGFSGCEGVGVGGGVGGWVGPGGGGGGR